MEAYFVIQAIKLYKWTLRQDNYERSLLRNQTLYHIILIDIYVSN